MTISEGLASYLLSLGALTALQGDRLYPERALEDTQTPYSIYHVEIREAEHPLTGPAPLFEATVEIHSCSQDYDQAFAVAEVLRVALTYLRGQIGAAPGVYISGSALDEIVGGYVAEVDLFAVRSKFTILYQPA